MALDTEIAQRLADHRTDAQIGHIVIVHDIEVHDVSASIEHRGNVFAETSEVSREYRGSKQEVRNRTTPGSWCNQEFYRPADSYSKRPETIMQRTTTGNRLACFFVAAAVLACSATVAQETEDATLSAPTLSGQISTNDTGPVDPLAGFDLEAEILSLALPGAPATALLSRSRRGEARGTLLLLPGDRRPYAGSATEQLYRLLPEHQWQVVLISLARLPSSHSGQLFAAKLPLLPMMPAR